MKTLTLLMLLASQSALAQTDYVESYYRKDGTFVQGHQRSRADDNPYNNIKPQYNDLDDDDGQLDYLEQTQQRRRRR